MQRYRVSQLSQLVVFAFVLLALVAPRLVAQAPPARITALSDEVKAWMERDQIQRWIALVAEGDSLFNTTSCQRCHGKQGIGGRNGPDLTDTTWTQSDGSLEGIRRTIFWGVKREDFKDPTRRFEMNPGGGANLTWDQFSSVAAYVWSLSHNPQAPR